ncbi:transposase [Fodinicurvata halophila]|uniref:Transposase n=1 Tax=Fodinicurvata halophila TaxID=1419723 RepID=A0ABV8UNZ3_9PROT
MKAAVCLGFDAGKKVKGRKRHILTDTGGLLISGIGHRTGVEDCDGVPDLLTDIRSAYPWLCLVFADVA